MWSYGLANELAESEPYASSEFVYFRLESHNTKHLEKVALKIFLNARTSVLNLYLNDAASIKEDIIHSYNDKAMCSELDWIAK